MNSKNQLTATDIAEVVVPCNELDPTLAFFTSELGVIFLLAIPTFSCSAANVLENPNTVSSSIKMSIGRISFTEARGVVL